MVQKALKKLNEKQMTYCKTISALIARADAMIQFNVNNQRKIQLTQTEPDGAVTVTTWEAERNGVREVESEYQISPGDFVMMLNWYRYQKENGNPDLNF